MTHSETIAAARAALSVEFSAWVAARDHAQEQVDRIQEELARLLKAETTALRLELAAKNAKAGS